MAFAFLYGWMLGAGGWGRAPGGKRLGGAPEWAADGGRPAPGGLFIADRKEYLGKRGAPVLRSGLSHRLTTAKRQIEPR
jgi:hypothetical protein